LVVYRHLKANNEVFYIGLGSQQRAYTKSGRNIFWKRVVNKNPDYKVEILARDLSLEDACELEQFLISIYGRRDLGTGTLVNLTDGGEGTVGMNMTDEHKNKLSLAKKGKVSAFKGKKHSDSSKEKLSKSLQGKTAWNKGKNLSKETKEKISKTKLSDTKKVALIDKEENILKVFNSLTEASRELKIHKNLISKVASGKRKTTNKLKFKYL
jgi:group I intron endonuclease